MSKEVLLRHVPKGEFRNVERRGVTCESMVKYGVRSSKFIWAPYVRGRYWSAKIY
jgi:hypothetical protein